MVKRRRPQRGRQPADRFGRQVDAADHRLEEVDHGRLELQRDQTANRSREIDLQGGQRLSELVVQLARDAGPLGLARRQEPGGECPQLLLGGAQAIVDRDTRGHVAPDALDRDHPARAVDNRPVAMLDLDDAAVGTDIAQDGRRPKVLRPLDHRDRGGAIIGVDDADAQFRLAHHLLGGIAGDRQRRGADVLGAARRKNPIAVDHVERIFGEQPEPLLALGEQTLGFDPLGDVAGDAFNIRLGRTIVIVRDEFLSFRRVEEVQIGFGRFARPLGIDHFVDNRDRGLCL